MIRKAFLFVSKTFIDHDVQDFTRKLVHGKNYSTYNKQLPVSLDLISIVFLPSSLSKKLWLVFIGKFVDGRQKIFFFLKSWFTHFFFQNMKNHAFGTFSKKIMVDFLFSYLNAEHTFVSFSCNVGVFYWK